MCLNLPRAFNSICPLACISIYCDSLALPHLTLRYFLFSKHLLPHMLREGRGAIINMASVQGAQSQPRVPAYAAVKGGVLSLTRQLGVEYAAKGIRVNSVSPGRMEMIRWCQHNSFFQQHSNSGKLAQSIWINLDSDIIAGMYFRFAHHIMYSLTVMLPSDQANLLFYLTSIWQVET